MKKILSNESQKKNIYHNLIINEEKKDIYSLINKKIPWYKQKICYNKFPCWTVIIFCLLFIIILISTIVAFIPYTIQVILIFKIIFFII